MPVETLKQDATGGVVLGPPQKATDLGTLGPYRVIRVIGRGGMGVVFLGVDPKLRRKVALKVMLPKYQAKPQARERFLREARAVAAVDDDHVVPIYHVDESHGTPFIALKYLQGATLEEYLRAGQSLTVDQMLLIARETAMGLQAAHAHHVIHRDIKPDNIWLEAPDGRVRLIDFGLARLPAQNTSQTADGAVMGTPAYMSPEQARGREIDARSDLFSLGSVIYRLFAGSPPFLGDSPFKVVMALTQHPHLPLMLANPQTPEPLSKLIDALLAKDPSQRPASAKDVVKELKRIEHSLLHAGAPPVTVIAVLENSNNEWASLDTQVLSGTPSHSARLTAPPARKLVWLWVAGALAIAVIAIAIVMSRGKPVKAVPRRTAVETIRSTFNG